MTIEALQEQLRETEALALEALKTLAETGNADALRASAETRARHEAALAQLERVQAQLDEIRTTIEQLREPRH